MITTMNNRLKQFLAAENISQSQFADKIKVVRASISHVLSGRNNPSYEFLKAMMENYPALNMEWLMFGKGRMYKDAETPLPAPVKPESAEAAHEDELFDDLFAAESDDESAVPAARYMQNAQIEPADSPSGTGLSTSLIKELIINTQQPIKQRNVSKVIVLFDDGSFQEL